MKHFLFLLSILSLLSTLVGCQASKTSGISAEFGTSISQNANVRYDDAKLGSKLVIGGAITKQNADGFLVAQVEAQNLTQKDLPVQYLFSWFDGEGMEIYPGKRPWQQKIFFGGEIANLQAVSPYPNAVAFRIHFRNL